MRDDDKVAAHEPDPDATIALLRARIDELNHRINTRQVALAAAVMWLDRQRGDNFTSALSRLAHEALES